MQINYKKNLIKLIVSAFTNERSIDEIIKKPEDDIDIIRYIKDEFLYRYPSDNYILSEYDFYKNIFSSNNVFSILERFSNIFFSFKNGKFRLKEDIYNEFHFLSSSIDEYLLIMPDLLSFIKENEFFLDFFTDKIEQFFPQIFLSEDIIPFLKKDLNTIPDMHVHLGGSLRFEYRLNFLLKNPIEGSKKIRELKDKDFPESIILKKMCNKNLYEIFLLLVLTERALIFTKDKEDKEEKENKNISEFYKVLKIYNSDKNLFYIEAIKLIKKTENYNIRNKNFYIKNLNQFDYLSKRLLLETKKHFHLENEKTDIFFADKLLLLFSIHTFKEAEKIENIFLRKFLRNIAWLYINLKNLFKSIYIQQAEREGLGFFSTYSKSKFRRDKVKKEKELIVNSLIKPTTSYPFINLLIEGRITPFYNKDLPKKFNQKMLEDDILEYKEIFEKYKKDLDNFKILFHFIKEPEKENKNEIWQNTKEKIKNQAFNVINLIESNSEFSNLIKGFDVAGKEYNTPPEVFAPLFRFLKNYQTFLNTSFSYTYHVGEDFPSLITGLRRVFEAIFFLDIRKDDRLSHLLAVGIEPKLVENNEFIENPMDVLDNLVFIYYILSKYRPKLASLRLKDIYIEKLIETIKLISNYSSYIYGDSSYNPDTLVKGWFLRRNCIFELEKIKKRIDKLLSKKIQKRIFEKKSSKNFESTKNNTYFFIKTILSNEKTLQNEIINIGRYRDIKDILFLKNAIPDFFDKDYIDEEEFFIFSNIPSESYQIFYEYRKNYRKTSPKNIKYVDAVRKLITNDLLLLIQDILLEEYIAKRGIIVEVLPTSNILIRQLNSIEEHPVFRFQPLDNSVDTHNIGVRKSKINVMLGSDDPGIQNTHILNEIAIIYNYIKNKKDSITAENYLKRIISQNQKIFTL